MLQREIITYQQATKVDLLEKDREKFFQNYQNKTVKEQKMRKSVF